MTAVLRDRNLRIFLGMDVLSLTGSSALWLALGIWVKSLTGSTAAAGMVIFAILAPPVLLAPAAGMLVDRVRRRPLLVDGQPRQRGRACCSCCWSTAATSSG